MWRELRKKTKVEIDIGKGDWTKRLGTAELFAALDESSRFTVTVALSPKEIAELPLSSVPKSANLTWNQKTMFRGHLSAMNILDGTCLLLEFSDELHLAKRISENEFFKQQTLHDILGKISGWLQVEASFSGDFGVVVPAFSVADRSIFDLITELSSNYGFFFFRSPSSSRISFLKLDRSYDQKTLKLGESVFGKSFQAHADSGFESVEVSAFDPGSASSKKREISGRTLYAPAAHFTQHSGYQVKASWPLAKGRFGTHAANISSFRGIDALFQQRLSKGLMGQEKRYAIAFEPVVLPGDCVEFGGRGILKVHEGAFLVSSVHLSVGAAIPRMEITAIRA